MTFSILADRLDNWIARNIFQSTVVLANPVSIVATPFDGWFKLRGALFIALVARLRNPAQKYENYQTPNDSERDICMSLALSLLCKGDNFKQSFGNTFGGLQRRAFLLLSAYGKKALFVPGSVPVVWGIG